MQVIFYILTWIWQLPQNILGWVHYQLNKEQIEKTEKLKLDFSNPKVHMISWKSDLGSVSLGNHIFCRSGDWTYQHEKGHHKQSLMLGPLYLLLIGLPSVTGYLIDVWCHKDWEYDARDKWYYNLPWEKWADKLGHVERWKK